MGKIITIHQPEHMPWLGFFNKMLKVDMFVFLDNVQFEKNYFQNRNKIATHNGEQYITVPVEMKGYTEKTIREMIIADCSQKNWKKKYLKTLSFTYCNHPYYNEIFPCIENIIISSSSKVCDLNIAIIKLIANLLSARCEFLRASDLCVQGSKSDLILEICSALNANIYISGPSGREYLNLESFKQEKIDVLFNDFIHPVYPQKGPKVFIPYMSIIDLLMNVAPSEARRIVLSGLPH